MVSEKNQIYYGPTLVLNLILSTVNVLTIWVFFGKETMGPSLSSSALDSSQKFTPIIIKNLKKLKILA